MTTLEEYLETMTVEECREKCFEAGGRRSVLYDDKPCIWGKEAENTECKHWDECLDDIVFREDGTVNWLMIDIDLEDLMRRIETVKESGGEDDG
ncbi:hypothetical protein AKJ57_03700 [candidate division MSBL1 archaeon SCGC-AAA259A05]|uniref:Uncharacterized protein n=1 Tax=candidate division MSBL1 archaeon SCGC-AAA259A05 TaxID=1698259 RepID=A0A133U9F5_9EURY|nr:hypothetical protein AKJ57_03700 [candidate division MSBL1 archaeon SCGC-AAA259A05]